MKSARVRRKSLAFAATVVCQSVLVFHASQAFAQAAASPGRPPANSDRQSGAPTPDDLRGQPVTTFNFKVAPGSLAAVLDGISAQSGAKYRTEGGALAGAASPGVVGRMGLREAVAQALAGTGWQVVSFDNGEIRLAPQAETPGAGEAGAVIVTARRQAFKENFSSVGTLTNTPLHETPATVDTVTQDVLESRNAYSLGEAIQNIPGAVFQEGGAPNQIVLGPTSTGGVTFTDGLRNGALADNEPTVLMESVEVLKGPASLLTGTEVGGALLNYVPKRASGITPTEVSAGYGSGNEETVSADVSGAIPHVDNLYFRVIGLAQHADENPAGGNRPYQYVVSPMLGYRSDNTKIDLSAQYFAQETPFARRDYMTLSPTAPSANGRIQSYGSIYNPDNLILTHFAQVGYNFEQTLLTTPDLTLEFRAKGVYQTGDRAIAAGTPALFLGPFVGVVSISEYDPETTNSHHVDLYSKFNTGPLEHQFIIGADYSVEDERRADAATVAFVPLGSPAPSLPAVPYDAPKEDLWTEQYGIVFQDQVNWGPVHALIGERYSWFDDRTTQPGGAPADAKVDKWTPSVGLVLDITKAVAIYGSYNQQFSPQPAGTVTASGALIPPSLVTRYEAGVKASLFADRLDLNASVFSYTTSDEALTDPTNPFVSIAGPGEKSSGFEFAGAGSITSTLKVTAGYTYTTGSFVGGLPITDAPMNVANFWAVKTFDIGDRSKIDVGFGGNYNDGYYMNQVGVPAPSNPSLLRAIKFNRDTLSFSGALGYTLGRVRFNLTVNNLFDQKNYALSSSNLLLERAEPRTFRFMVDARF
jgi:outer membrane receptor protein involved in Fe transport